MVLEYRNFNDQFVYIEVDEKLWRIDKIRLAVSEIIKKKGYIGGTVAKNPQGPVHNALNPDGSLDVESLDKI